MNTTAELKEALSPNGSINEAYDYIARVTKTQGRFLETDELYRAYISMKFSPALSFEKFSLLIECMKETLTEAA